jgi:ParB family transcriptional regulator, chromosome partitioning protein
LEIMDTTTTASATVREVSIQQVPIADLHPNPDQPRQEFEQIALEELAASIANIGLLQPIVVRPRAEGGFTIIAGERRWRACQLAGITSAPCSMKDEMSEADAYVLSVAENVSRKDMTDIEEAKAYAKLKDEFGRSLKEIAELYGKTENYVQYRLDLLNLREDIQHLVASKQLTFIVGWYMSLLSPAGQAEVLKEIQAGKLPTNDKACQFAKAIQIREQSPSLLEDDADADPLAAARQRVHLNKAQQAWVKIEETGPAMAKLMELSPAELEKAMGSNMALHHQRVEQLWKQVGRLRNQAREAQAIHVAKTGKEARNDKTA